MNISYNWLKELINIDLPAQEIAQRLTDVGLAVESVHPHGDDFVLDIDLTSNRPDCLSHLGVAREIGAMTEAKMRVADGVSQPVAATLTDTGNLVTIQDPELCHRFTARIIRNVDIGPSPSWLVDRLEAIGERSINNVADITNYVMHELGQPMHAFDLDKLADHRIVVRRARGGETITTLDEVDRKLDETMLAICDAEKPVAIGGIMGGLDSSITDTTTNVLLEVAYFNRQNIRQTSRRLNLATEASYRFERGVDIENLSNASNRAMALICELAGGDVGEFVDVYPHENIPVTIDSPDIVRAVKRLTGLDVDWEECNRILSALGIKATDRAEGDNLRSKTFLSPSWRHDLAIEEDLVEEVARHAGYDKIGTELPPAFSAGEYQENEHREKLLRQTLVDIGFDEAISYSFIDTRFDAIFETTPGLLNEQDEKFVTLRDSVIEGAVRMRHSILPGLLEAIRLNLNYGRRDAKLFEVGKVFAARSSEDNLPVEREVLAIAMTGGEMLQDKAIPIRDLDFYDAKGAVEAAVNAVGVIEVTFASSDVGHLRNGQAASISVDGNKIGNIGRLSRETEAFFKFRQPVFVAEIDLQTVLELTIEPIAYTPLAKYPAVSRDVSFVAPRNVSFDEIRGVVTEQGFELCRSVRFVDVFEGKGLAQDERSITIRLEYRSDERTLIEDEVEAIHKQIVEKIEQKLNIKRRI